MLKTIPSAELSFQIKQILDDIRHGEDRYIIEESGEPTAAIINIREFQLLRTIFDFFTQEPYTEASDPAVGLFAASPNLAESSKKILRSDINGQSGWTQKEPISS